MMFDQSLLPIISKRYWSSLRLRMRSGLGAIFPELRLRFLVGKGVAIKTQTSIVQRLTLFNVAKSCVQIGRFIEVGSYLGATSIVLAAAMQGARGGKVYCIDTWENDSMSEGKWNTWEAFCQNTRDWEKYIVPIVGKSALVNLPFEGQADLVFIDADHSYKGVTDDIHRFGNLVREDGYLVLHDHAYYPTVTLALGELLRAGGWYVSLSVENIIFLKRNIGWHAHRNDPNVISSLLTDSAMNEAH